MRMIIGAVGTSVALVGVVGTSAAQAQEQCVTGSRPDGTYIYERCRSGRDSEAPDILLDVTVDNTYVYA